MDGETAMVEKNAGNTGIFLRNGESLWEEKKTY